MNDDRWARLRDLFDRVRDLPPDERRAVLDAEAADEPELRAELDRLLAADSAADRFLSPPPGPAAHGTIGPYRLLEILGEGGFGVVWLAEQTEPIRRRVALKLIKPGMDSRQVVARFETERQALAMMDHPGIAQVFEAGATETGRPYFVMEHVPGDPITDFCDRERLRIGERLELFAAVCDAVQHAHQRGIIHRDLKPSNVIVTRKDGMPVAKVIDFGVVKATAPAPGDTLLTREGMIVGTLGYMSPEQAGAVDAAVDTRSDIYALGVILYELLTGKPPFDPERLGRAPLSEALRVVREEDPPALTAQVSRSAELLAAAAEHRSTDSRRLLRALTGELQWITLRALEKEPDRRYASAAELAADVRRHLAGEAVLAAAPSTAYRLRKLARRHRVGVAAAAAVLLAIVAGGVAAAVGFGRAVRAERVAQREAQSAGRVADFLVELFEAATPEVSGGETASAQTLLEQGTRRIEAGASFDPHVRLRLLTTLGNAHLGLGLKDDGLRLLQEALDVAESAQPADEGALAEQLSAKANGFLVAGQPDSVPPLLDRAMEIIARTDGPESRRMARALWLRGCLLTNRGELPAADSVLARAQELAESPERPDPSLLLNIVSTRATAAHRRFELEEAERLYLRVLELARANGSPTREASAHRGLAWLYATAGDPENAVAQAEEALVLTRKLFPPDHPKIAEALSGQAAALAAGGDYDGCIAAREEAVAILRAKGVEDRLAHELNSLGLVYRANGDPDRAIVRLEEACEIRRRIYGSDNARLAESLANLARCYAQAGRAERSEECYRQAIPLLERLSPGSAFTAWAYMGYGNLCRDADRLDRADSCYVSARAMLDSTSAGTRPYYGECLLDHAYLRTRQGRHDEAIALADTGFRILFGEEPEPGPELGAGYVLWAAVRAGAGDVDGATGTLSLAAAAGATDEDADAYPELAALRSRPDYPLAAGPR